VALAVSEIALQARNQAWQPVARNDANCGDRFTIGQESLRNQDLILAEPGFPRLRLKGPLESEAGCAWISDADATPCLLHHHAAGYPDVGKMPDVAQVYEIE
jgi:hypothetical protein